MPPNRQSSAAVLRSLSANDLAGFVSRSAYAPLTEALAAAEGPGKHHEEGKQQQQAAADGDSWHEHEHEHEHEHDLAGAAHGIDSDAYWGWPSLSSAPLDEAAAAAQVVHDDSGEEWDAELARRRALLASILAEEEARRAVSADFIVAKLVYDASHKRSARNEASAVETNSAEAIASSGRAQEDQEDQEEHKDEAYWHWEAETNSFSGDVDAGAGDARSSCLGVARIEELLKKEAVRIKLHSHSAAAVVVGSVRDDYWDWDALTPKQLRERLVSQIMADERARLLLTASHMEGTLKKARASTGPVVRSEEESREDYWAWDQERHMVHDPRTQDPTHPSKCYWDWSPPLSAEDAKSAVIRQIVEDEAARRAVSVEHVEEVLKGEASSNTESKNSRLEKREQVFVADNEEKVMEEDYWDM